MGEASTQEGTTSRYQVLGRLAGGGMADIFLARAVSEGGIERHVVLKRVLAERAKDPHLMKMFLDEARLAVQLHHPNIAQVFDFGKLGGSYFFTMEYIHGVDVRALRRRLVSMNKELPVNLAFHIAVGVLAGLHHAHERTGAGGSLGVVHRDVSPSNVMVSFDGGVKLLDFGVAKASQHTAESRTGVKGKISYLSPEQCRGKPLDRRSDIYSMGIVLHEMLTGKRLYKRDSDFDTMSAIVTEDTPAPSSLRAGLGPDIDRIVLKAMDKDPDKRYATAAEMAEDIETISVREYLRLSATAMGKFMHEVFGERPEPWTELATRDDVKPLTVTSSVIDPEVESPRAVGSNDPSTHDSFEIQLDRAPVWRADADSPGSAATPIPTEAIARAQSASEHEGPRPRFPTSTPAEPVPRTPLSPINLIKRAEDLPTAETPILDPPTQIMRPVVDEPDPSEAPTTIGAPLDMADHDFEEPPTVSMRPAVDPTPQQVFTGSYNHVETTPFVAVTKVDQAPAPSVRARAEAAGRSMVTYAKAHPPAVAATGVGLLLFILILVRAC